MRLLVIVSILCAGLYAQKPLIAPGGVVNAASLSAVGNGGRFLAPGSIVSIFGQNLASVTRAAAASPLPVSLGGSSVSVNGIPAGLFYVSPGQLNVLLPLSSFAVPSGGIRLPEQMDITVTTPFGSSDPYTVGVGDGSYFGIFTLDGSGCGRGAVVNVAADGGVSLNSPSNSASPGDYLVIYGTGIGGVYNLIPDGFAYPDSPLADLPGGGLWRASFGLLPDFPSTSVSSHVSWVGRAPGLIGVDQVNVQVPLTAPEGCAVPLTVTSTVSGRSQPIPVSIRKGGGECAVPPPTSLGRITWERVILYNVPTPSSTETLTATFPSAPGPQSVAVPDPLREATAQYLLGRSCPFPGYRNLDAGGLQIQAAGLPARQVAATDGAAFPVYRTQLPEGTIKPGVFQASATGGAELGAFQSSVAIGREIQITTTFPPGTSFSPYKPFLFTWAGGDPDSWVTLRFSSHSPLFDDVRATRALAATGAISLQGSSRNPNGLPSFGSGELIVEVTPDESKVSRFSAPGLALGGWHTWKYTYRFTGIKFE